MSTTQENVSSVTAFLNAMSTSDVEGIKALASDGFEYWVAGRTPLSGTSNLAQLTAAMPEFGKAFPNGLRISMTGTTAEHRRVAVEAEGSGITADGKTYENVYHFLFIFDDAGKIAKVREYMDTAHIMETFGQ